MSSQPRMIRATHRSVVALLTMVGVCSFLVGVLVGVVIS